MNKKGFTLVELLATIAVLAIISIIAVPNIMLIMENNKKSKVVSDAITFIALAKYEVAKDSELRIILDASGIQKTLQVLDTKNDVLNDPDNNAYNRDNSYVLIRKTNDVINYCVYLVSNNYIVSNNNNNCVSENILLGDNAKQYVNDVKS